jgi:hypothetical protein
MTGNPPRNQQNMQYRLGTLRCVVAGFKSGTPATAAIAGSMAAPQARRQSRGGVHADNSCQLDRLHCATANGGKKNLPV